MDPTICWMCWICCQMSLAKVILLDSPLQFPFFLRRWKMALLLQGMCNVVGDALERPRRFPASGGFLSTAFSSPKCMMMYDSMTIDSFFFPRPIRLQEGGYHNFFDIFLNLTRWSFTGQTCFFWPGPIVWLRDNVSELWGVSGYFESFR